MTMLVQNNSNSPMQIRTWVLMKDDIDESDKIWLHAFAISIHIDRPTHTFNVSSGATHTIYGKPKITITTTEDRQRDMLILKYGNDVFLLSEEWVMAHGQCVLDRINW